MSKPIIFDNKPAKVELSEGKTYYFCTCGGSSKQPFCDGSHKNTAFAPQAFSPEKSGNAYLCNCKQTKNPPYCDGSHNKLA
jgi:CDGSH-type Zn-finger protein